MAKNDGGPAFPQVANWDRLVGTFDVHGGMTLRDYFAGQALIAVGAAAANANHPGFTAEHFRPMARAAYALADEMLRAREG